MNPKASKSKYTVSILMPAYNTEMFISRAINSFLRQTYKDSELIIVNDGSQDQTLKTINKYCQKYSQRIKVINNPYQKGIPQSRNIALACAQGKYIGHLDSDDFLKKNAIEIAVQALSKKKVSLVYSGYFIVDENGHLISKYLAPKFNKNKLSKIGWQHFGMYKKSVALKVGGFNEKLITCSDGDFFIKIAKKFSCQNIGDYLYYYRWHKKNIGHSRVPCSKCQKKKFCAYYPIWKKEKKKFTITV